jgi:FkbM family methyltransferase
LSPVNVLAPYTHLVHDLRRRIEHTVSCGDCSAISKVPDAGIIVDGEQIMHNGVRVVAGGYFGEWMAEIIQRLDGHHEPQEERVFHEILERLAADTPQPVVMELGAFWAYYTLWALDRIPLATPVLVEPDPGNLEIGRRNFAINGRAGTFINAAVGERRGEPINFYCASDATTRLVAVEGLDSIMKLAEVDRVDMLLVDVQGAETPLLQGAFETLARGAVRFAMISTHHHTISDDEITHERCLDLLLRAGAHIVAEHTVYESFSGDGLIAVSFADEDRSLVVDVSRARARDSLYGDPTHEIAFERAQRRDERR